MRSNQRVLVLGGTGSIGGYVAETLRQRGHHVTCLVRSVKSRDILLADKFETLSGDIRSPDDWMECVRDFDAIVHAASTWSDDAEAVDRHLTATLLKALSTPEAEKTFIYTDGCWSYGDTGDEIATEDTPFDPLPEFSWSIETGNQVRAAKGVRGMVVLPAMVYERDGGVLEWMVDDARHRQSVRIIGGEAVRWPLVHRSDLAHLYALMLERGEQGAHFNGAGIVSMDVGKIAKVLARRFGKSEELDVIPIQAAAREFADWAVGYGLDQRMSGAKAMRELGWAPEHTDILSEIS